MPEAERGWARRYLRPRLRGRARRHLRLRPRGRASRGPRPDDCGWFALSFATFITLIWVSLFMVPNSNPRAFEGVEAPFQRFSFKGLFCLTWSFSTFSGGCARAHPPGVAPEPFGGMVLFLQRLLPLSVVVQST